MTSVLGPMRKPVQVGKIPCSGKALVLAEVTFDFEVRFIKLKEITLGCELDFVHFSGAARPC